MLCEMRNWRRGWACPRPAASAIDLRPIAAQLEIRVDVLVAGAALIVLLVCAAPICLLAHGLPQTEGLARLWWRAMLGALGVQVAQALTLAAIVHVFFASSSSVLGLSASGALIDLLLVICLFYVLLRIPFWVRELVFSGRPSTVGRVAKSYIAYKVVKGAIGGAL